MRIGVPLEIKAHERRVALVPSGVRELVRRGHSVLLQCGAGQGAGFDDESYRAAGADIALTAADVYGEADLLVKVNAPQPEEFDLLRADQTLFGFLDLGAAAELTYALIAAGTTAIAAEAVGGTTMPRPLLAPISEIAGRLAIQVGCQYLDSANGGRGVLLGGVPGVEHGVVTILGAGVAGMAAARRALGLEAQVTVLDVSLDRLTDIDRLFQGRVATRIATDEALDEATLAADLLVCCAMVPGAPAPKMISRTMVERMKAGAVLVDLAITAGGNAETARETNFAWPIFIEAGVVHYCVPNIAAAAARTASFAQANAALPYLLAIAEQGVRHALASDPVLRAGLSIHEGQVTHERVADTFGLTYVPAEHLLGR